MVQKLQQKQMDYLLRRHDGLQEQSYYCPEYFADDEYAIRKGHKYITCVMDLGKGDILWAGQVRTIKNFEKFFQHFEAKNYLSQEKSRCDGYECFLQYPALQKFAR